MVKLKTSPNRPFVLVYFLLAVGFTWAYWVPTALHSHGYITSAPPGWMAFVAGYGPALAALILTAVSTGPRGIQQLLRRLFLWRVRVYWYFVAVLLPLVTGIVAYLLQVIFDSVQELPLVPKESTSVAGNSVADFFLYVLMFTLGFDGLGEELGWRGYALPNLLKKYTALAASLVVGAFWAVWHLPFALTKNSAMSGQPIYHFTLVIIAASILYTWLFNQTQGSLLIAILFHAAGNITYNMIAPAFPGFYNTGSWGIIAPWMIVMMVVALYGPGLKKDRNTIQLTKQ